MHYLHALEKAINYIESHLYEDIDLLAVAHEAGYSLYHFHRIFKTATGDSLKDYIRKRRMTEAAKDLVYSEEPIVDIGIKHGYESREAFSRAFDKIYGRNPSEVRGSKSLYFIREPMDFDFLMYKYQLANKGLQPFFKKLPQTTIVGKRTKVKADGSNLHDIPLLWHKWHCEKEDEKIINRKYTDEYMGICIHSEGDDFEYMIGHEVTSTSDVPGHMDTYELDPSLYAVFRTLGPITESVQKTWDYIYSAWLIESEYEHAGTHDLEYYYHHQAALTADLYMPVIPRGG